MLICRRFLSPPYPSLEQTWARLQKWLASEYPELGDTLNYGILPQDLEEVEMALGVSLPQPVRESYLLVDGQEAESSAGCSEGLFFGLVFLPLEDVLEEWRFWREVDGDPATGANARLQEVMRSIPPDWVRREYSQRGWIPLVSDKTGNYLGVDLNPDEHGSVGQVIVFGRDFDTKVVMWRGDGAAGWAHWLAGFVEDLENGEGYELGHSSDGSEGDEDDVGYESYFFDGSGRAKGEGGGDSGGGLRLTGEYRGWNVLEAWADKSMKRWREAGLLPPAGSKSKAKGAKHGLGMLDLAAASGSGAEVPIPIMSEQDSTTPTAALTNVTNRTAAGPSDGRLPKVLPIISVTKPPAPLPVYLPSPQDFQSDSPSDSRRTSFDNDLERGRQLSIDEVEHPLSGTPVAVKPSTPTTPTARRSGDLATTVKEATLVQIPLNDSPSEMELVEAVTDLLQNDSSEGVPIAPIEPVATPVNEAADASNSLVDMNPSIASSATPAEVSSDTLETGVEEEIKVESKNESEEEPVIIEAPAVEVNGEPSAESVEEPLEQQDEDAESPDQTIRLVGGGGVVGIAAETDSETVDDTAKEHDLTDVASISSATTVRSSTDSARATPKAPKNEKKKSFSAGLKRISKLGGSSGAKRRTDSKEKVGMP
ncbi:hypothetical protein EW145_g4899 [Phellinidium pouzarii]|uniref:Knr4/Smi1-like domain-containing protein n=1 Tax=Phellinidium pouzarii TaxID=167371 RepID=A0A4S4L1X1_9AGAM|nr:hypothetical protein EW145_g4899 [Phellinidium pouzarii]